MKDILVYPNYMSRKKVVGDVTFRSRDGSGGQLTKQAHLDPDHAVIPEKFMVEFNEGGSGFIVKALKKPITIKSNQGKKCILGLLLSAGHVLCDAYNL